MLCVLATKFHDPLFFRSSTNVSSYSAFSKSPSPLSLSKKRIIESGSSFSKRLIVDIFFNFLLQYKVKWVRLVHSFKAGNIGVRNGTDGTDRTDENGCAEPPPKLNGTDGKIFIRSFVPSVLKRGGLCQTSIIVLFAHNKGRRRIVGSRKHFYVIEKCF